MEMADIVDLKPTAHNGRAGSIPVRRTRNTRRREECTYCPRPWSSKDHIPPSCVFENKRRILSVPSCEKCRKQWCGDDQYFWAQLAAREGDDIPEEVRLRFERTLEKPENRGLVRNMIASICKCEPDGRFSYKPDVHRLARVVERIAKGLYREEFGFKPPGSLMVKAWACDFIEYSKSLHDLTNLTLRYGQGRWLGFNNEVRYLRLVVHDDGRPNYSFIGPRVPRCVFWVIQFYGKTAFCVKMLPFE